MTAPTQAQLDKVSKFLRFILRHKPEAISLQLDSEGWAHIVTLVANAIQHDHYIDRHAIETVVATCSKKRYAISEDGQRIRAVQGHSTDAVKLTYTEQIPPEILYHGTATRFTDSIREQGLLPGTRHHVHLSAGILTAINVGKRHGVAFVFRVLAGEMYRQGFKFYQADNGVWLTDAVPAQFLNEKAEWPTTGNKE